MDPNWREYLADPDHTYTRDPVYPQDRYPKSTYPPTPLSPQYYPISDQGYPHNQALFYRDEWDCHNCDKSFDTELERDRHMDLCMQGIPVVEIKEPFYESIDNPPQLPTVLLFWGKERPTLEKEIQLFTQDGRAIKLIWSDLDRRFQTQTQMCAGEHDGLLIVSDINLTADIHSFYVAPTQRGAKMQEVELAIDDEKEIEKEIAKEVTEAVGEKGGEEKAKKTKLKDRFSKLVVSDGEVVATEIPMDYQKKVKLLQKENEKLSTELRDKGRKWSEESNKLKKQIENISKTGEAKREQLEKENHAYHDTNKALRKEFQQKIPKQYIDGNNLKDTHGECRCQLELREKENTDLTQQLATIQMIAGINEERVRDQQDELLEKRDKVIGLEDEIETLRQELTARDDVKERTLQTKVLEGNLQLDELKKELNKYRIICDSLRKETDKLRGELLVKKESRISTPDQIIMEETAQDEGLREQFGRVLKERDELILINRATKLDLENAKNQQRLEGINKRDKVTADPEIAKFFQNTIKRKDEELEEMKLSLTKLREYNLSIKREKQVYYERLENYRESLIPALRNQIQNLTANQLSSEVCLSEISYPSAPLEFHSLSSPVDQSYSPLLITHPKPLGAFSLPSYQTGTPNTPDSPLKGPTLFNLQDLPPPLHIQKQISINKDLYA